MLERGGEGEGNEEGVRRKVNSGVPNHAPEGSSTDIVATNDATKHTSTEIGWTKDNSMYTATARDTIPYHITPRDTSTDVGTAKHLSEQRGTRR